MVRLRSAARVVSVDQARARAAAWRAAGERVVLAVGDFDPLEAGDARALAMARAGGTRLIAAVRGDRLSASRGAGRPLVAAADRARLVAGLRAVDLVLVLDDLPGTDLARELEPVRVVELPGGAGGVVARVRAARAGGV
jgi:bifunctional ADP-heptose synthase (sugar kinase/adenylyltransferase)